METTIVVLSAIGLSAAAIWLCKLYLRATELQSIWRKRIDDLRGADWGIARRRLTDAEFDHLHTALINHQRDATGELAPTLREVIVQFHVNP